MRFAFVFGIWLVAAHSPSRGQAPSSPTNALQKQVVVLQRMLSAPGSDSSQVFDRLFDWPLVTRRGFLSNWVNISAAWQEKLQGAVRTRVLRKGMEYLNEIVSEVSVQDLRWISEKVDQSDGRVYLDILHKGSVVSVMFRVSRHYDTWKLYDIRTPDFRLRDYIRTFNALINEGYSMDYIAAVLAENPVLWIDNFDSQSTGEPPKYWGWRKRDAEDMASTSRYRVQTRPEGNILQLDGGSYPMLRPFSYNIREYPVLSWKWRSRANGGEVSSEPIAKVSIIFYQNWIGIPITVNFLWSPGLAPCSLWKTDGWFVDDYDVVVQSGKHASDWLVEEVNIRETYRSLFGEYPPDQCAGISLWVQSGYEVEMDNIAAKTHSVSLSCNP